MSSLNEDLHTRMDALTTQGLRRELRTVHSPHGPSVQLDAATVLNFSSNDYLGFANHPEIKQASIEATQKFGTGSGASRLISGSLQPHNDLEKELAYFKGTEAALSFSSGYAAATGTIGALVNREDVIILDKLVHASIVDAARLSGARLRVFHHNDPDDLEGILKWTKTSQETATTKPARVLIVTESVFSMDGDVAPLRRIVELKEQYNAWLMVDEAHGTGIFGNSGEGLAEDLGVARRVDIHMGTLGKAFGASGGYVCGSRVLIDFLVNQARSFIFSTAPCPGNSAAATAAIKIMQSAEGAARREQLWRNITHLASSGIVREAHSAIVPVMIGDENEAVACSTRLLEEGIFIPAIRYPTVARKKARLRISLSANHQPSDIEQLISALKRFVPGH